MEQIKENAQKLINKLDAKDFGIYFFTLDTKGNPTAGVANIYEHVKILTELGYNAYILHEEIEYTSVGEWLGDEYSKLKHVAIKAQNHEITNNDIIVIPEVFANVMEQWVNVPAKKVVLCQSYDYIFELLKIGMSWGNFGIRDVITTTQTQANYIKSVFPHVTTHVVPVSIPDYFKPSDKPKKPVISILTRDQKDALKIVKSFYAQYPIYKWITFRELRGMTRKNFAKSLGESCLSIWVDPISGFGTFPVESIECETPVIGVIPNMVPEWMAKTTEDGQTIIKGNGVWVNNTLAIPELIANFMKVWFEDSVPASITDGIKESKGRYTYDSQLKSVSEVYGGLVNKRKEEILASIEKQ